MNAFDACRMPLPRLAGKRKARIPSMSRTHG
jgi:hypothetical protein